LTNEGRIDWLVLEAEALYGLGAGPGHEVAVPSCPGWSVGDVVGHVGGAHRWCSRVLAGGEATSSRPSSDAKMEMAQLLPWYREGLEEMLGQLRSTPPDRPTWTPVPAGTAGWWTRKMVVETALHRWDAADAVAFAHGRTPEPVAFEIAVDGIDEFVGDFVTGLVRRSGGTAPAGAVELVALDGPKSWTMDLGGSRDGTVTTVSGSASDLVLWLWNRLPDPLERLQIEGDTTVVERWLTLTI
jgi:uncharacterized protein (TIGR03083 family)